MKRLGEYITEWISSGKNSNSKLRFPSGKMTVEKTAKWLKGLGVKEIPWKTFSQYGNNMNSVVLAPGELAFVCGPCMPGEVNIGTYWIAVLGNTSDSGTKCTQELCIWEDEEKGRLRTSGKDGIENIDMDTCIYLLVDMVSYPKKEIKL